MQNLQLPAIGPADKDGMAIEANHSLKHHPGPKAEIVGFVCRWLLLAGAVVLIGLVGWECLLATVGVSQDVHSRFVVADTIVQTGAKSNSRCYQWGLLVGRRSPTGTLAALGIHLTDPVSVCRHSKGDRFWGRWPNCQPGRMSVTYRGVPYSSLAFQQQTASILSLPKGRPITLIDMRFARAAARDQADIWRQTVAVLETTGEVVLFFDGSVGQFADVLGEYRESGGEMPVVFQKEPAPYIFAKLAHKLALNKRDSIRIVTADADLAVKSGQAGFVVNLIATSPASTRQTRGVVRHASLERFKDSLLPLPIR